ncbi:MAG: SGNH/GDSL hydrolase family protein [Lentisphaeria bacterium]|nr:SGNH/GDSL hydrolase family protein [Lentisphaeria bacterium]
MNNCTKQPQNMLDKKYQENIVPAEKQNGKNIYLGNSCGSPKVLFVGNSVTKHGVKEDIGWLRDCGMAASCAECDYVHIVAEEFRKKHPQSSFGILQVASFERNFDKNFNILEEYREVIDWQADIVILFFGANVQANYDAGLPHKANFGAEYEKLRNLLNLGNTVFYHVEGFFLRPEVTNDRYEVCQKYHDTWISLEGINDLAETHGLFNHPNDLGMKLIAERILENIITE